MSASAAGVALRGADARRALTHEWDELAWANPRATVFQTSHWYAAWMEAVAEHERAEPLVLCVPASGRMRAGLALQISRDPVPTLRPLSWPWADYHEGVGSPFDDEAVEELAAALGELLAAERCPLVLDDVVGGGILERVARRLGAAESMSSHTAAVDLSNAARVAFILGRREHLLKSRRLGRLGPVACRHHVEPSEIERRMPAFVELHSRRWGARPDAVAAFDGAVIDAAFAAMVRRLAPRGLLLLTELTLSGRAVAMYFGFAYGRRYGGYRTAFDEELRRLSPGHLMLREMVADFAAAGFTELDLMRGAYAYKYDYADRAGRNLLFEVGAPGRAEEGGVAG